MCFLCPMYFVYCPLSCIIFVYCPMYLSVLLSFVLCILSFVLFPCVICLLSFVLSNLCVVLYICLLCCPLSYVFIFSIALYLLPVVLFHFNIVPKFSPEADWPKTILGFNGILLTNTLKYLSL